MMKLCPALTIILAVLSVGSGAAAQDTDKALYAALQEADALDRTLDKLVQPGLIALLRDAEIEEPVEINGPPQPKTLNVLIVDGKKLAAVRTDHATVKRLLPSIANNVLAIPPGTIVFDNSVISALTLNAHNELLNLAQGVDAAKALGPRASSEAMRAEIGKFAALADYLRYRNIRNDRENFDSGQRATTLASDLARAAADLDDYKSLFTMMLAPIILHEIGHLRRGTTGTYEQGLVGPLGAATLSLILREENAADDFAVERMRYVIRKKVVDRRVSVPVLMLEVQPAIATIKYMRDQVLEDTFGGFRGLNTEDLLVNIEHWDCNVRKGIKELRFDNPDKVRSAYPGSFPLMTQAEFDGARTKIQQRIARGTHSHHFTRGDRFMEAIEREGRLGTSGFLSGSLVFLDAMVRNEPMRLYPVVGTTGTGLSIGELNRELNVEVLPVMNCPEGMCSVSRFKDYAGFVEAVGPMNDLRHARITFPLFSPSRLPPDKDSEEYLKYLALTVRLLANVMGDKTVDGARTTAQFLQTPAVQLAVRMRKMSLDCGVGFVGTPVGKRYVRIRTLNEKNWVTIDVMPLPASPQQKGTPKGKRK